MLHDWILVGSSLCERISIFVEVRQVLVLRRRPEMYPFTFIPPNMVWRPSLFRELFGFFLSGVPFSCPLGPFRVGCPKKPRIVVNPRSRDFCVWSSRNFFPVRLSDPGAQTGISAFDHVFSVAYLTILLTSSSLCMFLHLRLSPPFFGSTSSPGGR